jgi:putative tricarboxylic transport membrane protein
MWAVHSAPYGWRKLAFALLGALVAMASATVTAQTWKPTKPVAFIAGSSAGGSIDLTARALQQAWDSRKTVGQPIIVLNKPGGGNGIAWSYMNDKGADGHTIAIGTTNLVSNSIAGIHPISYKDVTPLAIMFNDYSIQLVRADSPLKSMHDAVERLRKDAGALSIAVAPTLGSGPHTAAAIALLAAGVNVKSARFIAYKSASEAITALVGGEVDVVSTTPASATAFFTSGRIRAIAMSSPKRLEGIYATVPTLKEQGIDATFTNWRGVIGPKGMPKATIAFWEHAIIEASNSDEWKKDLDRYYFTPNLNMGASLMQFLQSEDVKFRSIWQNLGITL